MDKQNINPYWEKIYDALGYDKHKSIQMIHKRCMKIDG